MNIAGINVEDMPHLQQPGSQKVPWTCLNFFGHQISCSPIPPRMKELRWEQGSGIHAVSRVYLKARTPLVTILCLARHLIFSFSLATAKKIYGCTADICALLWTGTVLIGYVLYNCSNVLPDIVTWWVPNLLFILLVPRWSNIQKAL